MRIFVLLGSKSNPQVRNAMEENSTLNVSGQKEILNIDEVARLTGLSRSTIYKLTSKHEIPYYKPAGRKHLHFRRDEIMAWMLRGRIKTNEEMEQVIILASPYIIRSETYQILMRRQYSFLTLNSYHHDRVPI